MPTARSSTSTARLTDERSRTIQAGEADAPRSGFRGSADALGQRDDNPLRTPDISHPPRALVLADATDQPVAVRGRPINGRLQVMDLEGHVAQSQLVGGGGRRTGQVVWPGEA